MSWWTKLREIDQRGLFHAKREGWKLVTDAGYVFDRRWFIGFMVLTILATMIVMSQVGIKSYSYVSCPNESMTPCVNPLYQQCDKYYCQLAMLPRGFSAGERPPIWLTQFPWYVGGGLLLVFVVNHLLYNRKFEFGED